MSIQHDTRYFRSGDVLWYRPRANPTLGDLVLYDLPVQAVTVRQAGYPVNVRIEGQRINRLVAVAGQRLSSHDGKLLVDGHVSQWQPLSLPLSGESIVPPDPCFHPSRGPCTGPISGRHA